jgi:hypothetical protein
MGKECQEGRCIEGANNTQGHRKTHAVSKQFSAKVSPKGPFPNPALPTFCIHKYAGTCSIQPQEVREFEG